MPKIVKPLTDTEIKKAKPSKKQYNLSDGQGLSLIITPNGSKYFKYDDTFNKKPNSLSFCTYLESSLRVAREKRTGMTL